MPIKVQEKVYNEILAAWNVDRKERVGMAPPLMEALHKMVMKNREEAASIARQQYYHYLTFKHDSAECGICGGAEDAVLHYQLEESLKLELFKKASK